MAKKFLRRIAKYSLISFVIVAAVTAAVLIFSFVTASYPSLDNVLTANFIVGGLVIFMGLLSLSSVPASRVDGGAAAGRLNFDLQKNMAKAHWNDKYKSEIPKLFYIGIGIVAITALAQLIVNFIPI